MLELSQINMAERQLRNVLSQHIIDFFPYLNHFRNWPFVLLKTRLNKYPILLRLRNGLTYSAEDFIDLWVNTQAISSSVGKLRIVRKDDWFGDCDAVFKREEYEWLRPSERVVVDIGANTGDSMLYFVIKGASIVIAVEPFLVNFEILLKNIELNGLSDRVIPLNAIAGERDGPTYISVDKEVNPGTKAAETDDGVRIERISLSSIVRRFQIRNGVLKVDCEGCEYGLIINTPDEDLGQFDRIVVEYHYGYEKLVHKLESASFSVRYTRPRNTISGTNTNLSVGYIYAEKNK